MRRGNAVAVLALVALTACAGSTEIPVSGEAQAISADEVEFTFGCHEEVRLEVEERPDRVVVTGIGTDRIDGDCASLAVAKLEHPLGDRDVVDGVSGRTVVVLPPGE